MNETQEHPWQPARDRFESEVLPKLERIGKEIGKKASEGNEAAKEVMEKYTMLHRSFDPITLMLLEEALEKYES